MILLSDIPLPARVTANLRRFQDEVSASPDYADQVAAAKRLWLAKTHSAKKTFGTVRAALVKAHQGDYHCCYCGFSKADAIDHVRPRSLYPELTFVWENYVHACGSCNNYKSAHFAIFSSAAAIHPTEVARKAGALVAPPIPGKPALIDPRRENPMEFLFMDFFSEIEGVEHCRYLPSPGISERARSRAEYTITLLGLNTRNELIEGRKSAFGSYRDKLSEYVRLKQSGESASKLQHRVAAIKTERHRAVWEELKRWYRKQWRSRDDELPLIFKNFDAAPEALDW